MQKFTLLSTVQYELFTHIGKLNATHVKAKFHLQLVTNINLILEYEIPFLSREHSSPFVLCIKLLLLYQK